MIRRWRLFVAAMMLFAGCAPTAQPSGVLGRLWHLEFGPDYRRPPVDAPTDFRGHIGTADAASSPAWRLLGPFAAIAGMLMFGIATAELFAMVQAFIDGHEIQPSFDQD